MPAGHRGNVHPAGALAVRNAEPHSRGDTTAARPLVNDSDAMTFATTSQDWVGRELARRRSGDLDVTLYWRPADFHVWVDVVDLATGESFSVPANDHPPLEVFNHPFLYTSVRHADLVSAA